MPEDPEPIAVDAYDELADSYAVDVRENAYNAHLEFPATSSLVPDVSGDRVLDAGCGTGVYTTWLLEQGAAVVGVDASEEMLSHARDAVDDLAETGDGGEHVDRVEFHRADLGDPLDFLAAESFAGVVSPLALGYVRDWEEVFAEFERILEPGGFVVFSTGHPIDQFGPEEPDAENYFAVEQLTKEWDVPVPFYRRPFSAVVQPVLDAGFDLESIVEPQPTAAFADERPERYEKESRNPVFLCVKARKPGD